jgi:cytochrome c-type biogenesis protein CcsB
VIRTRNEFNRMNKLFWISVLLIAGLTEISGAAVAPAPHKTWSFSDLSRIPIQNGGRVKPLDTFAREVVLFETGSRKFEGWEPVEMILSWISTPHAWDSKAFIRISRGDVKRQLGLDEKQEFFSPQELLSNPILLQYAEKMSSSGSQSPNPANNSKANPREQELKAVFERISTFRAAIAGEIWRVIPKTPPETWGSLLDAHLADDQVAELIKSNFVQLLKAYQEGNQDRFERNAVVLKASVEGGISDYSKVTGKVNVEVLYNTYRPFLYAWILYLGAFLSWCLYQFNAQVGWMKVFRRIAYPMTIGAFFIHCVGFGMRCYIAGRPPVTNMYESVIWVSLGAVFFSIVLSALHRHTILLAVGTALGMFGLVVGDAAPSVLDASIQPLVPVLRSNYWLTIHVLTITLGYAAFALTLGLANLSLFSFLRRAQLSKILTLNQMMYRAMQFGVVLIAAGTILGGVWADYSWGRFWGWDPKEVWALITLLSYLVVLHGRYAGWIGNLGFAAWSAISFLSVVMAWYGVNFILGVGLHSYGFSTGGTPWVIAFVGAELLYVGTVVLFCRKEKPLVKPAALAPTIEKLPLGLKQYSEKILHSTQNQEVFDQE